MKVRIFRQSYGSVQGVSLRLYRPGQVYDLPAALAAYVVAEGLGIIEMRIDREASQPFHPERRRSLPSPPSGQ
jgi:hypothetical protein